MRTLALLLALTGAAAPALAQDLAALKTDPVLRTQEAQVHLDALRARVRKMRDRGESWQGRFDRSVGLAGAAAQGDFRPITNPPGSKAQGDFRPISNPPGAQPAPKAPAAGGEAAFKPIFNPPTAAEQAPGLRAEGAALRGAVGRIKALKLTGAAAGAVVQLDAGLRALEAAPDPAAADAALEQIDAALKALSAR